MHSPKPHSRWLTFGAATVAACTVFAAVTVAATESSRESAFTLENASAMARMMKGMEVKPSGNVDLDFARMMIAHHQGAIDMALAELRHGRNERLRRLAQEIIVNQRQEIEAMQMVIDQELPLANSDPSDPRAMTGEGLPGSPAQRPAHGAKP